MQTSIPAVRTMGQPLPSIPAGFGLPFYYSSLFNVGVFYQVEVERVLPYLEGSGLVPAVLDGRAVVSYNFQLYTGQFPQGSSVTQEVELNILAVPENSQELVAIVSFEEYMRGEEQTKLMGNHRVWVPCDNENAIQAGVQLFGEPKFKTTFQVLLASLNDPSQQTWMFSIQDPSLDNEFIYRVTVDMTGLPAFPGNFSPITEYGRHEGQLIGCRWNMLQPVQTYFLQPADAGRVKLELGTSTHQMKADVQQLIGDTAPGAVRLTQSAPAAIQSRAYYPSPIV
jgi:hypothetical protein